MALFCGIRTTTRRVPGLSVGALIVTDLLCLSHGTPSQRPGRRDMSLLQQNIRHITSRSSLSFWFREALPEVNACPFTLIT
jgi:hypothetical protein